MKLTLLTREVTPYYFRRARKRLTSPTLFAGNALTALAGLDEISERLPRLLTFTTWRGILRVTHNAENG